MNSESSAINSINHPLATDLGLVVDPILNCSLNLAGVQRSSSGGDQDNLYLADSSVTLDHLASPACTHSAFTSGEFIVDSTGQVSIDYLFDGGGFQGQLAIFSLEGLDAWTLGSPGFIQEAARRALSNSDLGHIVINDQVEGAAFSAELPWEGNFNQGNYVGPKTMIMRPGTTFGIMLVPNGTVEDVFANPTLEGAIHPLFSLSTANPQAVEHLGQIADVTGAGSTFVMEDLRFDTGSDRDYNDIIFQVRGATGNAARLDQVINQERDWREVPIGKALLQYVNFPPTDLEPIIPVDLASEIPIPSNQPPLDTAPQIPITSSLNQLEIIELTKNLDPADIQQFNEALVNLRIKIDQSSHDPEITIDLENEPEIQIIQKILEQEPRLAVVIQAPDLLVQLGITSTNVAHLQTWLQDPDLLQELGLPDAASKDLAEAIVLTADQPIRSLNLQELFAQTDSHLADLKISTALIKSDDLIKASTPLHYEILSTNNPSLTVHLEGNELQLAAGSQAGRVEVLIRGTDPEGLSVIKSITVTTAPFKSEIIRGLDRAIAQWQTAIDAGELDNIEPILNQLGTLLEQQPQLIDLIDQPQVLLEMGFSASSLALIQHMTQDPQFSQAMGLPIPLKDLLQQSEQLDLFQIDAEGGLSLLPEDSVQPFVGFLDFTKANHARHVTDAFASVNPLADFEVLPIYHGEWHQRLTQLVDQIKATGKDHAIVNLSFDLSQVDDVGYSTRYELAPEEQAAIAYAQQNNVLLVVATGNTGNRMSALGEAAKRFDNIITVGAVTSWEKRADYSSYGNTLTLMAPGGEWKDDPNAFVGTSRATAYVTAAASLVWATNPDLNYRQVIELLKETAVDLETIGWDAETGAGLLNIEEAVRQALQSRFMPYQTLFPIQRSPQSILPFSGAERVLTLARPVSDESNAAILQLQIQEQQLSQQQQRLGQTELSQVELQARVDQQFTDVLNAYQQISRTVGVTDAETQQLTEALRLAAAHYKIEQGRLQGLTDQEAQLIEQLAALARQRDDLEAASQQHLQTISEAIRVAGEDLRTAEEKRNFELLPPQIHLFEPLAAQDSANQQRQLAETFRQQAAIAVAQRDQEQAQQRWQITGYRRGKSGKREPIWGYAPDPQHQWLAQIAEQNRWFLAQQADQAEQAAIALEQYAAYLSNQQAMDTDFSAVDINDAVLMLESLQQQLQQQQQIAKTYWNEAALADQRRQQNQGTADWHTRNLRTQVLQRGKSGRPKQVWEYHPERIPPRDQAQHNAMLAAEDSQGLERLARQADQHIAVIQQQVQTLQHWIRDWAELNQSTLQAVNYEIASDQNRQQAEQDLMALFTPIYQQKLETLDHEIIQAQIKLTQLRNRQQSQDAATEAIRDRLQQIETQVQTAQADRLNALQDLQTFLSTAGVLLPHPERLAAVDRQVQTLTHQIDQVRDLMTQLNQIPTAELSVAQLTATGYLNVLQDELQWWLKLQEFLRLMKPGSTEQLADFLSQLASPLQEMQQQNTQWQQLLSEQRASAAALLVTRQTATDERLQLVPLQSQLAETTSELQTLIAQQNTLEATQASANQTLSLIQLELRAKQQALRNLEELDKTLADTQAAAYYEARDRQSRVWFLTGQEYTYNPAEAAAYRQKLEESSFIADQRNKGWQQQQANQQSIKALEQQITTQQQQIAQRSEQLADLQNQITELQTTATNLQTQTAPLVTALNPLLQQEKGQTQAFLNQLEQGQTLATQLANQTRSTVASLKRQISAGLLAAEVDVGYMPQQVEPAVRDFITQLQQRQPLFETQIADLTELIATWQRELVFTTDPTAQATLTNLINQTRSQLAALQVWGAENAAAATELESLLEQVATVLLPLRQKQALELSQQLDVNATRLEALQSQQQVEQAAKTAVQQNTASSYQDLQNTVRQDLQQGAVTWTQQFLDGNQMTRRLAQEQQDLSQATDALINEIQQSFADPYSRYQLQTAALEDAIATFGATAPRFDQLQQQILDLQQNTEDLQLQITQDQRLWQDVAPLRDRYAEETEALQALNTPYPPIHAANEMAAQANALQAQAINLIQQLRNALSANSSDTQSLVQSLTSLLLQADDQQQQAEESLLTTIEQLRQQFITTENPPIPYLSADTRQQIRQLLEGITTYLPQLTAAKNAQAIYAARAATAFAQAVDYEQQAQAQPDRATALLQSVQALRQQALADLIQANQWQQQRQQVLTQISHDAAVAAEPLHRWEWINANLNNGSAITQLQAEIAAGDQKYQQLLQQTTAQQTDLQARGSAALAQANFHEQQAAINWVYSRKTGPTWEEWRQVWYRSGCKKKFTWELVTHIDQYWNNWEVNWNLAQTLRTQGIDDLAQADRLQQEAERLQPIAQSWADAAATANLAETPITEARNLMQQLQVAHEQIPATEAQLQRLTELFPLLQQQLFEARQAAEQANERLQQTWTDYDPAAADYRNVIAAILDQRSQRDRQAVEMQQVIEQSSQWLNQQSTALDTELAQAQQIQTTLHLQRLLQQQILDQTQQQIRAIDTTLQNQPSLSTDLQTQRDRLQNTLTESQQKAEVLQQSEQLIQNKVTLLTAQQTAFTQKRTLLTAQTEVIQAEERLLDAYLADPAADATALQAQVQATRAALAEAQRLAALAEASSQAISTPLHTLTLQLAAQNDQHLQAAQQFQKTLQDLVQAATANANYTLQAAQLQTQLNQLEQQIMERLLTISENGSEEARRLLEVAAHTNMATAAEVYFRDYDHLGNDKDSSCTGGLATEEDRRLAQAYFQEWQRHLQLQQLAQQQADQLKQARLTAEAQINHLQQQQTTIAQQLAILNQKIATTQTEKDQKEQELAIAQIRLDAIAQLRQQTEQTFVNLVTLEELNQAQAELERQIAARRQQAITQAEQARLEREQAELDRQRQDAIARIEQIRQLQTEDELRLALNQIRGDLSQPELDATNNSNALQTQLNQLLESLQGLEAEQPELSDTLKTLLTEVKTELTLAIDSTESQAIQQRLLQATSDLIQQIQPYRIEIALLNRLAEQDALLLETAEQNLQQGSQQLWEAMQQSGELERLRGIIDPLYLEAVYKVAFAQQAVDVSNEMREQALKAIKDIIKQRQEARKARERAAWNSILGIISQVIGIISTVLMWFPATTMIGLALGAVSGAINVIQSAVNGDWMGAIFSAVMTGVNFIGGAIGNGLEAGKNFVLGMAKATAQKFLNTLNTLKALAYGAYSSVQSFLSGDSIMGFLHILGGLASAATNGISSFVKGGVQSLDDIGEFGYKLLESLTQAPQLIYGGIQSIQNGEWVDGIGNLIKSFTSLAKTWTNNFQEDESTGEKIANILENVSSVGIGASKFITGGLDGILGGLGAILEGLGDDIANWVKNILDTENSLRNQETADDSSDEDISEFNLGNDEDEADFWSDDTDSISFTQELFNWLEENHRKSQMASGRFLLAKANTGIGQDGEPTIDAFGRQIRWNDGGDGINSLPESQQQEAVLKGEVVDIGDSSFSSSKSNSSSYSPILLLQTPSIRGDGSRALFLDLSLYSAGFDLSSGIFSMRSNTVNADLLSGYLRDGYWLNESGNDVYGRDAYVGISSVSVSIPINQSYFVGIDKNTLTANATLTVIPDSGFNFSAGYNLVSGAFTLGSSSNTSRTDEQVRFGLGLGEGLGLRLHWGDQDQDSYRELGAGFDIGPFSLDIKTEDPVQTTHRVLPIIFPILVPLYYFELNQKLLQLVQP